MEKCRKIDGKIELRSEKVRKILSDIPSSLIHWGTFTILMLFVILVVSVCFIPYPYSSGESILMHFLSNK
jgi:hypothetical protein